MFLERRKNTLANQRPEEKQESTRTVEQRQEAPSVWTDSEAELLLNMTLGCKVCKTAENTM